MRATARRALIARAVALPAALVLVASCSSSGRAGATSPAISSSGAAPGALEAAGAPARDAAPERQGSETVELPLLDATRPTVTSWGHRVAESRSLPTKVWVPAGAGPFPLVVFAHGYRVGTTPYERFAEVLQSAGYLVAAPSFPLTDAARAGADLDEADTDNEAADISFVLTEVLRDRFVGPLVDPAAVAVAGHSDGASAAVQVGYGPVGADRRVKAVVALTGGAPGRPVAGPALLVAQSDTDEYDDLSTGHELYDDVRAPTKWFLTLHGASHLGPVAGGTRWTPILDDTVVAFLDRYLKRSTSADDAITRPAAEDPELATIVTGDHTWPAAPAPASLDEATDPGSDAASGQREDLGPVVGDADGVLDVAGQ